MQKRINYFLNRRFPDFLSCKEGIIYFILLIPFLSLSITFLQPHGLNNWHEFHKNLVVFSYCVTCLGTYALVYKLKKIVKPHYFNPETWTIAKQFRFLLANYLPALVCSTLLFMLNSVEEFKLNIQSFSQLLLYNCILIAYCISLFGFFISVKLKAIIYPFEEKEEFAEVAKEAELDIIPVIDKAKEQPLTDIELKTPCALPSQIVINGIPLVVDDICYIEIKVNDMYFWMLRNRELYEISTRYTMKKLKCDLEKYDQFLTCQKSFIVNMRHLKDWDIINNKTVIHPKYCSIEITATRNKSEEIKLILRKNHVFKAK